MMEWESQLLVENAKTNVFVLNHIRLSLPKSDARNEVLDRLEALRGAISRYEAGKKATEQASSLKNHGIIAENNT